MAHAEPRELTASTEPAPEAPPGAANEAPAPELPMPAHFRAKRLKAAWQDLIESTDASLHTKENRFTFEFAATLMAKFRAGTAMTATESKELKRLLLVLGLAKNDDDQGQGKTGNLSKYRR
jgi:hypothetical protein